MLDFLIAFTEAFNMYLKSLERLFKLFVHGIVTIFDRTSARKIRPRTIRTTCSSHSKNTAWKVQKIGFDRLSSKSSHDAFSDHPFRGLLKEHEGKTCGIDKDFRLFLGVSEFGAYVGRFQTVQGVDASLLFI